MKFVVDMNLSPQWIETLQRAGWEVVHWSTVGNPRSSDREIMQWAKSTGFIVLTHDLDFGSLLAATHSAKPSVVQVRTQDVLPDRLGDVLVSELREHQRALEEGALLVIDRAQSRVRILPLN